MTIKILIIKKLLLYIYLNKFSFNSIMNLITLIYNHPKSHKYTFSYYSRNVIFKRIFERIFELKMKYD